MLSVANKLFILSVFNAECCNQALYAECHYGECHHAVCLC
jgi:hypothetical protein